uniref:Uncharacterized protein n=1 Tax=Schistocephalus solidus TaxID=70667 RepID=A0A0V0JC99_SCHSO
MLDNSNIFSEEREEESQACVPLSSVSSYLFGVAAEPGDAIIDTSVSTEDADADVGNVYVNKLREWALRFNIADAHLRVVMDIFRPLVPELPADPRTLLGASYNL